MAAALQRAQLNRLCATPETLDKAQSILRIVTAKTRPGSGFAVKSTVAIPAICAYLASEQSNAGEVSLQSAVSASCVTQAEFQETLKKVRAALCVEEQTADVTYESLVDAYDIHPKQDAIGCMKDAERALPSATMFKDRYGAHVVSCAIFYWVCHLMEEPAVRERTLCRTYAISPKSFKAIMATLDKQCDGVADQIKSHLVRKRARPAVTETNTAVVTPSKKRTVTFARLEDAAGNDGTPFPETPTKKRRVASSMSPDKPSTTKRASTAAFHAALKASPTKPSTPATDRESRSVAGPSTPRRPRSPVKTAVTTPVRSSTRPPPSRSQGQTSPTRQPARRRFRPVFLEQQQWCARDPKVERMWAAVDAILAGQHGHAFQRFSQRTAVGVA